MISVGKNSSLSISLPVLIGAIAGGFSVILLVGLLSGLVARPNSKLIHLFRLLLV
jgi:hypothetical protein